MTYVTIEGYMCERCGCRWGARNGAGSAPSQTRPTARNARPGTETNPAGKIFHRKKSPNRGRNAQQKNPIGPRSP